MSTKNDGSELRRPVTKKDIVVGIVVCCLMLVIAVYFLAGGDSKTSSEVNRPAPQPRAPVETESQFMESTRSIQGKQDGNGIFIKEYLKNPKKFAGIRLNVVGKIMEIEESGGRTGLQMYVNRNYDTVIVQYPGSVAFYKDDLIRVYGIGAGVFEGQNRFGATITVPLIEAKYIKKFVRNEK